MRAPACASPARQRVQFADSPAAARPQGPPWTLRTHSEAKSQHCAEVAQLRSTNRQLQSEVEQLTAMTLRREEQDETSLLKREDQLRQELEEHRAQSLHELELARQEVQTLELAVRMKSEEVTALSKAAARPQDNVELQVARARVDALEADRAQQEVLSKAEAREARQELQRYRDAQQQCEAERAALQGQLRAAGPDHRALQDQVYELAKDNKRLKSMLAVQEEKVAALECEQDDLVRRARVVESLQ